MKIIKAFDLTECMTWFPTMGTLIISWTYLPGAVTNDVCMWTMLTWGKVQHLRWLPLVISYGTSAGSFIGKFSKFRMNLNRSDCLWWMMNSYTSEHKAASSFSSLNCSGMWLNLNASLVWLTTIFWQGFNTPLTYFASFTSHKKCKWKNG